MQPGRTGFTALATTLLAATAALASEFWLQPGSYRVAPGAPVPVKLLVGAGFTGEAWARPTRKVRNFKRVGPAGAADTTDLRPALLADSVAPAVRCPGPGTHAVLLNSYPAFVELPGPQFTAYLKEEGLELPLLRRRELGLTDKPGREAYRRCTKTLLWAGPLAPTLDSAVLRPLGVPLELVAEQNPYRLAANGTLTVRLLRFGQPVGGARVQGWDASLPGPARHFISYTNKQGRLLLRLPGPGPYLLAAVRMETAPPALAARADWLSTWTSLTFGGPATGMGTR